MLLALLMAASLAGMRPAAKGQVPSAKPAPAAQNVLPVYIEEFFLSEAVRSEEHGELQLTLDGMASNPRQPASCP